MGVTDRTLTTVYLTKDLDDKLKALAYKLSNKTRKITISDLIVAAIASSLQKFYHIEADVLKAYFQLEIDIDLLAEMDKETLKAVMAIMK